MLVAMYVWRVAYLRKAANCGCKFLRQASKLFFSAKRQKEKHAETSILNFVTACRPYTARY